MKHRTKIQALAVLAAAGFVGGAGLDAIVEPQSPAGYALFRARYAFSASKAAVVEDYRRQIWTHGGGYIRPRTQRFMIARLDEGAPSERVAVADFYVRQARGREYGLNALLPESAREHLIATIFQRLNGYNRREQINALFLIEELRRGGEEFGKGGFSVADNAQFARIRRGRTQDHVVKDAYLSWWGLHLLWDEQRHHDPLAGIGVDVGAL